MFFEFFAPIPKIVPVGKTTRITLRGNFMQRSIAYLKRDSELLLKYVPANGAFPDGHPGAWEEMYDYPFSVSKDDPDALVFNVAPEEEGELVFELLTRKDGQTRSVIRFSTYALKEDLYALQPYKGDLHVHTSFSECGSRDNDPCFVAATGRRKGLDFMAITDHLQREGSEKAIEYFRNKKCALEIYPGEECHILKKKKETLFCSNRDIYTSNHIVGFGTSQGVIRYMNDHYDEFMKDVHARMEKLPESISEELRFTMVSSDWLFDTIHRFGGLGIFCHPYWNPCSRLNLPAVVREYIFEQNKYDIMELIGLGGAWMHDENLRNVARWQKECMKRGKYIPAAGNTDSHNARAHLGVNYSIVFAKSPAYGDVAEAFRKSLSVACMRSVDPRLDIYGDPRLVDYAYYLAREYFPEHDERCEAEGLALLSELQNEKDFSDPGHLRG